MMKMGIKPELSRSRVGGWWTTTSACFLKNIDRVRIIGNNIELDEEDGTAAIRFFSTATETRYQDHIFETASGVSWSDGEVTGTGTRTLANGVGENDGDPNSEGEWDGNGYEGATVVYTTNGDIYIYRDGSWVC